MTHNSTHIPVLVSLLPLGLIVAVIALGAVFMRGKGYPRGGNGNIVVQCRRGHLFTTIWIPLVSFKAVRLGPVRYQYCPVGSHWSFVDIVNVSDLTPEQRQFAASHRDSNIP